MSDLPVRIDRALDDLRSLGAEIGNQDFGYPVEAATFAGGADESRIAAVARSSKPHCQPITSIS